jgi:hypothetical protein
MVNNGVQAGACMTKHVWELPLQLIVGRGAIFRHLVLNLAFPCNSWE